MGEHGGYFGQAKTNYLNEYLIYANRLVLNMFCGFKNAGISNFRDGKWFNIMNYQKSGVNIRVLNRTVVIVKIIEWENWFSAFR